VTRPRKDVLDEAGAVQVAVDAVGFALSEAAAVVVDCAEICGIREKPSSLSLLLSSYPVLSSIQHPGVASRIFV